MNAMLKMLKSKQVLMTTFTGFVLVVGIYAFSCQSTNTAFSNNCMPETQQCGEQEDKKILLAGTEQQAGFRCSMRDKAGNLWFGSTGVGLFRYDGKKFKQFAETEGLGNTSVYSILEDKAGDIWVGTKDGVYLLPSGEEGFRRFPFLQMEDDLFFPLFDKAIGRTKASNTVFSINQDKTGNIWFGTERFGLCRFDGKTQPYRVARHAGLTAGQAGFTSFMNIDGSWRALPGDSLNFYCKTNTGFVQNIMEDRSGDIWFSTVGKGSIGLYRFDGETEFKPFTLPQQTTGHIFYMIQDRPGNIWMATRNDGVIRYSQEGIMTRFDATDGVCQMGSVSLLEDKKGNIWMSNIGNAGTRGGCVSVFNGNVQVGKAAITSIPLDGLKNTRIWTMLEDKMGNIWFGTKDLGLYRYDGKTITDFSMEVNPC